MSDGEKEYIAEQLQAIVGVEIMITSIVGKTKMSQNREPRDLNGVIDALRERGQTEVAEAIIRAKPSGD